MPASTRGEPTPYLPPLRPRRGLFVALTVGFILWLGVLLALYFTTVRR